MPGRRLVEAVFAVLLRIVVIERKGVDATICGEVKRNA